MTSFFGGPKFRSTYALAGGIAHALSPSSGEQPEGGAQPLESNRRAVPLIPASL